LASWHKLSTKNRMPRGLAPADRLAYDTLRVQTVQIMGRYPID